MHTLSFIKRARSLGFSTKRIAVLLSLRQNKARSSAEVKRLALKHVEELEDKIRELQAMRNTIKQLADHCQGDHRPSCPILDRLALQAGPTPTKTKMKD